MKISISLLLLFLFAVSTLVAQTVKVEGTVCDRYDVLIGATILIAKKKTNLASEQSIISNTPVAKITYQVLAITDIDGKYSFMCNVGDSIVVRCIAYQSYGWKVKGAEKKRKVKLEIDYRYTSSPSPWLGSRNSIAAAATYSPYNNKFGGSLTYYHTFSEETDNKLSKMGVNATYSRPDWSADGMFITQFNMKTPSLGIPYTHGRKNYIHLSGGVGYYWNVSDRLDIRSGNMAMYTNLHFWRKSRIVKDKMTIDLSVGYNWFVGRHNDDHVSFNIRFYPFTRIFHY